MKYVNVAINLPVKNLFKQFTYQLPPELAHVDVGWRVVVPFGAQTVEGFVVALEAAAPGRICLQRGFGNAGYSSLVRCRNAGDGFMAVRVLSVLTGRGDAAFYSRQDRHQASGDIQ